MTRNKVIKNNNYSYKRGVEYLINGKILKFSKMVKGKLAFRDADNKLIYVNPN